MPAKSPLDSLSSSQRVLVGAVLLFVAAAVVAVRGCNTPPPAQQPTPAPTLPNRNVRFGMPADAKADPEHRNAYLIDRPQYVLSYNDSTKNPNWVCWNLTKSDIGDTKRDTSFEPDPDLPKGFVRVKSSDYIKSGFDQGHMCPSKDRSDTPENNNITFYMTNVVPQSPNSNRKAWQVLEKHCRTLAEQGNELYIACGPHGRGGIGEGGALATHIVGKSKTQIEVPESVWKVVLVLPNKDTMPTQTSHAFAVWMPNDQTVGTDWKSYAVKVSEVEQRTGYTFFPLVPPDLAGPIKDRRDTEP